MSKICAVVVTYNRLELLKEVIEQLLAVEDNLDKIIVVNNASTDETHNYLNKKTLSDPVVEEYLMEQNLGGAGGFHHGIKHAFEQNFDYMWLMDDDSMVSKNSLNPLLTAFETVDDIGFACSRVLWVDGLPHKMNIPDVSRENLNGIAFFQDYGYVNVNSCSFVSVLISREVVMKIGLPYKEFFIWCDDLEYTRRIIKNGFRGIFCNESVVEHKTSVNYNTNIKDCSFNEFWKIKYGFRNRTFMHRNFKEYDLLVLNFGRNCIRALSRKDYRVRAIYIVFISFFKGLFFNPKE